VKHHVIISGTGRSGTTFLVQLLTELGMDTGFADPFSGIHAHCNAGMEKDIREVGAPYFIKSPWLCDTLGDVLAAGDTVIDHALIPIRDLYSAAESRRDVMRRVDVSVFGAADTVPGGLWHTQRPDDQENVLAVQLHKLLYTLAMYDVSTTLLFFPRLVRDPQYLYRKLKVVLGDVNYEAFAQAFNVLSRPELVHEYGSRTVEEEPIGGPRSD
jgi:hypothetical protein